MGLSSKITSDEYLELIEVGSLKDPLLFLNSIMKGQDPREPSELLELVNSIDELSEGCPSPEDWAELCELVRSQYKNRNIPVHQSLSASRILAEYLHTKKKSIDITTNSTSTVEVQELTPEEIKRFKEKFYESF